MDKCQVTGVIHAEHLQDAAQMLTNMIGQYEEQTRFSLWNRCIAKQTLKTCSSWHSML